jgi:hypothetical protein
MANRIVVLSDSPARAVKDIRVALNAAERRDKGLVEAFHSQYLAQPQ